jgi:eukaryotic-like serine/threonine-protein kinase
LAREPLRDGDPSRVGRYRLTARLGAGGMGVVYLGVSPDWWDGGGQVAIKVLRPELADDPEFRARFGREVGSLMRVRGECTVRVIEADTRAPQPFMVTEYAAGPSLSEYIDSSGPLGPDMLYGLATGLAEALTAIHAAGVVHRDLKPSNVILGQSGPKVIDFGIAQTLDATSVTKTGMMVGSPGFMAPEQVKGQAGQAADVFSWAVTVAYAASGRPPFGTGESLAILYRILHDAADVAAVPETLRPLVISALAKEPRQRPTARELLDHLADPSAGHDRAAQAVLACTWPATEPGASRPVLSAPVPASAAPPGAAPPSPAPPCPAPPGAGSPTAPSSVGPPMAAPPATGHPRVGPPATGRPRASEPRTRRPGPVRRPRPAPSCSRTARRARPPGRGCPAAAGSAAGPP